MRRAAALVSLALIGATAGAQTPAPRDSTRRDSVVVDTTVPFLRRDASGRPCEYQGADAPFELVAAELAAAPALIAASPGLVMCRRDDPKQRRVGWGEDHAAVYATGGPAFSDSSGASWAFGGSAELLLHGVFTELRVENFRLPQRFQYRTLHAGFFTQKAPSLVGGVTVGYRDVPDLPRHSGVEIAFPLAWGRPDAWAHIETAYVLGAHTPSWNFRAQGEWALRGSPFVVGLNLEAFTVPLRNSGDPILVPLGLVLGARL